LMAVLVLIYSKVLQSLNSSSIVRQASIGLLFGAAAIISMVDPIILAPGIVADARSVSVVLAAPFGGPIALLVAATMAGAYRVWLGGAGVFPSIVSIVAVCLVGMAFCRFVAREAAAMRLRDLLFLGVGANVWLVGIFLLPWDVATGFFANAALPIAAVTTVGVMLVGSLLVRERRRLRAEEEVRQQATTDPLTRLANRRAFDDRLQQVIRSSRASGDPVALILVDIDRFKQVNDQLGHAAGDQVLTTIGNKLKSVLPADGLAARIGGEEFVILLPNTDADAALVVGERARGLIGEGPIRAGDSIIQVSVSVGIAVESGHDLVGGQLMNDADVALYEAKKDGRNRVRLANAPVERMASIA